MAKNKTQNKGEIKNKPGRPLGWRKKVDPDPETVVETMAQVGCTDDEIAIAIGVSEMTIRNNYLAPLQRGRSNMKLRLRKEQLHYAFNGNAQLLIWLGKQYLSQRDSLDVNNADQATEPRKGWTTVKFNDND